MKYHKGTSRNQHRLVLFDCLRVGALKRSSKYIMSCYGSVRLRLFWVALVLMVLSSAGARGQRVALDARSEKAAAVGAVPGSEMMTLTLRLAMSAGQRAALETLLDEQTTTSDAAFHRWLTPAEFGGSFGAGDDAVAAVSAWAQAQGMTVESVSPSGLRVKVSGSAERVQRAFAVKLARYEVDGARYVANADLPSVPQDMAGRIAGVTGLNHALGKSAAGLLQDDAYAALADVVDANTQAVVMVPEAVCSGDFVAADVAAYRELLEQANAQGMTVIAASGCGAGDLPAGLAEVTAVALSVGAKSVADFVALEARPLWQSAPGLPNDDARDEADLMTASLDGFAATLQAIVAQDGRQGNINKVLYELAPVKGLYTQPDATSTTAPGTWEQGSGLGVVNLDVLKKVYPRATSALQTATSTPVASTTTASYGQPVTLTAQVTEVGTQGATQPTGTVSFMSGNVNIGSALVSGGAAALTVTSLNVGTYMITASYSGDATYGASTSTGSASVTITSVNAALSASISPLGQVPYGATATVTATVALSNSSAVPSGMVSATVEGIANSTTTAVLSPNSGVNSATANIVVAAPAPGSYTVQVTCAGNQNFQCGTPVNIAPFTTIKGSTMTSLAVSPAAPEAGVPATLTATISNAGNAVGNYSFTGTVSFFDNGKLLTSSPVGTNAATATVSLLGNAVHGITATYSGDANWNGGSSAVQSVTSVLLPSTITVSSNVPTGGQAGLNVALTATVSSSILATAGPTATVTFWDSFNGAVEQLGTASLAPNGVVQSIARFSTTNLLAGTHDIYAVYSGDQIYATSTSATVPLTLSDFSVTLTPATVTVAQGSNAQVGVTAAAVSGFSGTVTLSCTPPVSADIGCSFSPVTISPGGTTTMTITTTGGSSTSSMRWMAGSGLLWAAVVWGLPRRLRMPGMLILLSMVTLVTMAGCNVGAVQNVATGGSSSSGSPLGTEIVTVTAAGTTTLGTVRHTYQYQVTVQ